MSSGTVGFPDVKLRNLTSANVRCQGSIDKEERIVACSCTNSVILAIFEIVQNSGALGTQKMNREISTHYVCTCSL